MKTSTQQAVNKPECTYVRTTISHTELCITIHSRLINQTGKSKQMIKQAIQSQLERQRKCVQIQNSLSNQNIIKCYKISGTDNGIQIIQQKYIGNLREFNNLSEFTYRFKLLSIFCAAKALKKIQQQKIIHNAVTPEAICICEKTKKFLVAKLNNFYMCRTQKPKQLSQDFQIKKHCYSSPQILNQLNDISSKSDVWSLGATFYESLFGNIDKLIRNKCKVQISYPQGTPNWLMTILEGMLAFQPSKRYTIGHLISVFNCAVNCIQTTEKVFAQIDYSRWTPPKKI